MLQAFEEGYRFFADNAGAYFASEDGALFTEKASPKTVNLITRQAKAL